MPYCTMMMMMVDSWCAGRRLPRLLASTISLALAVLAVLTVGCGGGGGKAFGTGATATNQNGPGSGKPLTPTSDGSVPPTSGEWIDVDVTDYVVKLMDAKWVLAKISPVAVGEQIDTGKYASTQTGLFHVYEKNADLTQDV